VRKTRLIIVMAIIVAALGMLAATTKKSAPARTLPPPGIDIVEHKLRLGIQRITPGPSGKLPTECEDAKAVGAKVEEIEKIDFSGRMILRRNAVAKMTEGKMKGHSAQEFTVLAWAASGYSKKLNVAIQYILTPEGEAQQPASRIISEKEGPAFPVTLQFNLIFDAYANNRLVVKKHHGAPVGHNFQVIPPNGDRALSPTIKEFENCWVQMPDPTQPNALLRFFPIECNDQSGRTVQVLAAK
jgi:hypothetical protein